MQKTHVVFLLDKSVNMSSVRDDVVQSWNSQIQCIKKSKGKQECKVSVYLYNTDVERLIFNTDIDEAQELAVLDYKPSSRSSLYTVLEKSLKDVESIDDKETSFIFFVLNDGSEYISAKHTELGRKISALQDSGRWTFTYAGPNSDVEVLGFPKGNCLKTEMSTSGLITFLHKQLKYLSTFFMARSYGTKGTRGFYGSDV